MNKHNNYFLILSRILGFLLLATVFLFGYYHFEKNRVQVTSKTVIPIEFTTDTESLIAPTTINVPSSKRTDPLEAIKDNGKASFDTLRKDFLTNLSKAELIFETPTSMNYKKTETLTLSIYPHNLDAQLLQKIKEIKAKSHIGSETVVMFNQMEAKLTADGESFDILPITPIKQAVENNTVTAWKWAVIPKKHGTKNIYVSLNTMIKIEGTEIERSIKVYEKQIEVKISIWKRLLDFFEKYWQWVCTVVFFPLLALLWKSEFIKSQLKNIIKDKK